MLSKANNDLLTQTGPGTPGGKLLRSYWQPVATSDEMPVGGDPMPVRIMSEDLVLFRDNHDELGLIGLHCPHRATDLSYGRVEDGGLRCLYHGWLFDRHGNCLDQPAEPANRKFCERIKHKAYPVKEMGGVIWTYMGPGDAPLIPPFQFLTAPETNRIAFRTILKCNWLQSLESSTDPAHTTYLHRIALGNRSIRSGNDVRSLRGTDMPEIDIEPTGFGTRIFALHNSPNGKKYLRINNYVYPCIATPSTSTGDAGYQGRWYVPIDDHSCCVFEFIYRHSQPLDKDALRKFRAANVAQDLRHVRRQENRYLQDRKAQGEISFSGMGDYFPAQDAFAVETQGTIQDRFEEHLGSTDIVITGIRKILLDAMKKMEAGEPAPGVLRGGSTDPFADFICTSGFINDDEDSFSHCRRLLTERNQAN